MMKCGLFSLLLLLASCGQHPSSPAVDPPVFQVDDLKGVAAFSEVADFLRSGSGIAGSVAVSNAADYLVARLQKAGVSATIDVFVDAVPGGSNTFRNVVGIIPGTRDNILILGAHYDLKSGIDSFVGANDSGSGVGLLLGLAPILKAGRGDRAEVWLVFFDGEECKISYGADDGLHGSRHLASKLAGAGAVSRVQAFIILDMIGDKNLTVTIPRNSDPGLISAVFKAAAEAGTRAAFSLCDYPILDDHQPFLDLGIPAIDLIDFQYGSAPRLNDYWHTSQDTLDKLSAGSLETVGQVLLRVLNDLQHQSKL